MFEALKLLRVILVESPVLQIRPLIFCPQNILAFIHTECFSTFAQVIAVFNIKPVDLE